MGPQKGREALNELPKDPSTIPVDERWITIDGGPTGSVRVRIVKPPHVQGSLPTVVYIHGLKARLERAESPCAMTAAQISELVEALSGLSAVLGEATGRNALRCTQA